MEPNSRSASELLEAAEVEAAAIIKAAESEAASANDRWIQNLEQANEGLLAEHDILAERLSSTKQLLAHLEARLVQIAAVPAGIVPPSSDVAPPQAPNVPTVLPPRSVGRNRCRVTDSLLLGEIDGGVVVGVRQRRSVVAGMM